MWFLWPCTAAGGRQCLRPGAADLWPDGWCLTWLNPALNWRTEGYFKGPCAPFCWTLSRCVMCKGWTPSFIWSSIWKPKGLLAQDEDCGQNPIQAKLTQFRTDPAGTKHIQPAEQHRHLSAGDEWHRCIIPEGWMDADLVVRILYPNPCTDIKRDLRSAHVRFSVTWHVPLHLCVFDRLYVFLSTFSSWLSVHTLLYLSYLHTHTNARVATHWQKYPSAKKRHKVNMYIYECMCNTWASPDTVACLHWHYFY